MDSLQAWVIHRSVDTRASQASASAGERRISTSLPSRDHVCIRARFESNDRKCQRRMECRESTIPSDSTFPLHTRVRRVTREAVPQPFSDTIRSVDIISTTSLEALLVRSSIPKCRHSKKNLKPKG